MSLSDYERRVLREIESELAADDRARRSRRSGLALAALVIAMLGAAIADLAVDFADALPDAAATVISLVIGVVLGTAAWALWRRWRRGPGTAAARSPSE
jgi:hypothetical protein